MNTGHLFSDYHIIVFDWIGTILMMGTLWGWIYSRISHSIKQKLKKTDRHYKALERYVRIKYGHNFEKLPALFRRRDHDKNIGIYPNSSLRTVFIQILREIHIRKMLTKYGLATEDDKKRWELFSTDSSLITRIGISYFLNKLKAQLQFKAAKIIDKITYSLFSGKIGISLFILGFILWNFSKILALSK